MNRDQEMPNDDFRARENELPFDENSDGMPSVNRAKKSGNKVANFFFMLLIGGAAAGLIYAVNFGGKNKAVEAAEVKPAGSNNLPPLQIPTPPPPPPPARVAPMQSAPPLANQQQPAAPAPGQPIKGPNGKPILHWADRKLIGTVVVQQQGGQRQQTQGGRVPNYPAAQAQNGGQAGGFGPGGSNGLASRLEPTPMVGVSASLLADRNFIVTKGTSLDCALETAIDTTLPGIITCRMTRDVYSDNGQVLLMERGTQLVGEQQGNVKQGQARVFALWTRAKTPNGVIINLNSPGADSLGRSGLDGWVDHHFAERFGAAILMSFIQASLDVMVEKAKEGNEDGATVLQDTTNEGEGVVSKILDQTIKIPPTIIKNQGDHINVMVARDLDFSTVYDLEVAQ